MADLAHVAAAERFATAAIVSFESCEKAGFGLTELQKVTVLEALFLQFDGFANHLSALEELRELLNESGDS